MKNYGAQEKKIGEMFPEESPEVIRAIDQGYYKAFPGVKLYQAFCYDIANRQPYATNLFGVRYWGVAGHKLINMYIQGGSATLLKERMLEVYKFLQAGNYKSKMGIPIHDEVQFNMVESEMHIIPHIKAILETWDVPIPIVADLEITRTYWSKKESA